MLPSLRSLLLDSGGVNTCCYPNCREPSCSTTLPLCVAHGKVMNVDGGSSMTPAQTAAARPAPGPRSVNGAPGPDERSAIYRTKTAPRPRQPSPSDAGPARSTSQPLAHSRPLSPGHSGSPARKRARLGSARTNGSEHEARPNGAGPRINGTHSAGQAPADLERYVFNKATEEPPSPSHSPSRSGAVGASVPEPEPNGVGIRDSCLAVPRQSSRPEQFPKTRPGHQTSRVNAKAQSSNVHMRSDVANWFSRSLHATASSPTSLDTCKIKANARSFISDAETAAAQPPRPVQLGDLDMADYSPATAAVEGRPVANGGTRLANSEPAIIRRHAERGEDETPEAEADSIEERVRSLDSWIYRQEGAASPPPGLDLELPVPESQTAPTPNPSRSQQFFARIDPRIHWTRPQSDAWLEAKQQEIKARGSRRARMGKVAERMAELRKKGAAAAVEDDVPEKFEGNKDWMRAKKWFDECDKRRWEEDKEETLNPGAKRGLIRSRR